MVTCARARTHAHTLSLSLSLSLHRAMIPRIATEFRAEMLHPCLSLPFTHSFAWSLSVCLSNRNAHIHTYILDLRVYAVSISSLTVRKRGYNTPPSLSLSLSLSLSFVRASLPLKHKHRHTHPHILSRFVCVRGIYQSVYLYIYMAFTDLLSIYLQAQMNECVFFGIRNVTHTWRFTLQGSNKH